MIFNKIITQIVIIQACLFGCELSVHAQNTSLSVVRDLDIYKKELAIQPQGEIVKLQDYIPHLKTDLVYGTAKNFTHTILYRHPAALATKSLAEKLERVNAILNKKGYGILVYDAYRPYSVTEKMWKIVPDARYAANPAKGSDHNRGTAIDLTLYNLKTGDTLPMPTGFDNFTVKAHRNYNQLTKLQIQNRTILTAAMVAEGFEPLSTEWWHFSLPYSSAYPVLDIDFSEFD